jgi:hypothetical protein
MQQFKTLELEDKILFEEYLKGYSFSTYEYSFSTLYLWRKLCNIEYSIIDNALIIKKTEKNKGSYFMYPLGVKKDKLKELVLKLNNLKMSINGMKDLFRDIEEPFLEELREVFEDKLKYYEDENNFDYIYEGKKLIDLSGKALHGKKNHYNQFVNLYNYELRDLNNESTAKDCIDFSNKWSEVKEQLSEQLKREMDGIKDLIENQNKLPISGIAVYVDGKIVGFTIGEKVNNKMAIIHIEKGDADYKGIYAFINKTYVEKYLSGVEFINREEDLGIEGLRKAKMSYHPVKLEKKYIVNLI